MTGKRVGNVRIVALVQNGFERQELWGSWRTLHAKERSAVASDASWPDCRRDPHSLRKEGYIERTPAKSGSSDSIESSAGEIVTTPAWVMGTFSPPMSQERCTSCHGSLVELPYDRDGP